MHSQWAIHIFIFTPETIIHDPLVLHTVYTEGRIQTLSSRWMIMGTSLASMTACTCCWFPAVMLDRNHTASYRTKSTNTKVSFVLWSWAVEPQRCTCIQVLSWPKTWFYYATPSTRTRTHGVSLFTRAKTLVKNEFFCIWTGSESRGPLREFDLWSRLSAVGGARAVLRL